MGKYLISASTLTELRLNRFHSRGLFESGVRHTVSCSTFLSPLYRVDTRPVSIRISRYPTGQTKFSNQYFEIIFWFRPNPPNIKFRGEINKILFSILLALKTTDCKANVKGCLFTLTCIEHHTCNRGKQPVTTVTASV